MRIFLYLLSVALFLSAATACKQKSGKEIVKEQPDKRTDEKDSAVTTTQQTEIPTGNQPAETTLQSPTEAIISESQPDNNMNVWQKIEVYVNTSPIEKNPMLIEIKNQMGKDWTYTITQLWYMVQFNKKKKLSKGVTGLTEANFDDKYDEQYDIAIRGGY